MVQGRKNIEVAALVEFCVWQRNVAHAEMSALVLCRGEFANPVMTTLLVACCILCHTENL